MENKEKIQIEIIKGQIEIEKTALDRYVKSIVRSAFLDCCTGGAFFNEMYHNLLKNGFEEIRNSKLYDSLKEVKKVPKKKKIVMGKTSSRKIKRGKTTSTQIKR